MPGNVPIPETRPTIPLRSMVRDRTNGRLGVLISYGQRAARCLYGPDIKTQQFWIKLRNLEAVPMEEIEEMRRKVTEDLV